MVLMSEQANRDPVTDTSTVSDVVISLSSVWALFQLLPIKKNNKKSYSTLDFSHETSVTDTSQMNSTLTGLQGGDVGEAVSQFSRGFDSLRV